MCLVNSVRSSSLIVCVTFAEEPWTCILPPVLPFDWCPGEATGEGPSLGVLSPRALPVVIRGVVADWEVFRIFEMS